jgi:hypothetical protein
MAEEHLHQTIGSGSSCPHRLTAEGLEDGQQPALIVHAAFVLHLATGAPGG